MQGKGRPDIATVLSVFDRKARQQSVVSREEMHAITAFLTGRVNEFALFETAPSQLRQLVQNSTVVHVEEGSSDSGASDDSLDLLAQVDEVRNAPYHACNRLIGSLFLACKVLSTRTSYAGADTGWCQGGITHSSVPPWRAKQCLHASLARTSVCVGRQ
jgi:hypothetical protein